MSCAAGAGRSYSWCRPRGGRAPSPPASAPRPYPGGYMQQLRFGTKLSYAMGGMALNLANLVIPVAYEALCSLARLGPGAGALFAGIFFSGRLMDGVIDPVAGFVSDHFQSKRGRRIPLYRRHDGPRRACELSPVGAALPRRGALAQRRVPLRAGTALLHLLDLPRQSLYGAVAGDHLQPRRTL